MTRNMVCWAVALLGLCLWVATPAMAQEHPKGEHPKGEHPKGGDEGKKAEHPGGGKEAMEAMMKAAAPGPHHEALKAEEGNWDAVTKISMDPTKPPSEEKGTEECKMILGGRFLQFTFHGTMGGQPFEGRGLTGYDNVKKKHTLLWMDEGSTSIFYAEGECTDNCKSTTYVGDMTEANGTIKKLKYVEKHASADDRTLEMYEPGPDGKEVKVMEIHYTRKK